MSLLVAGCRLCWSLLLCFLALVDYWTLDFVSLLDLPSNQKTFWNTVDIEWCQSIRGMSSVQHLRVKVVYWFRLKYKKVCRSFALIEVLIPHYNIQHSVESKSLALRMLQVRLCTFRKMYFKYQVLQKRCPLLITYYTSHIRLLSLKISIYPSNGWVC